MELSDLVDYQLRCYNEVLHYIVRNSALLLILLLTARNNLLYLAVFCQDDRLRIHFTNHPESLAKQGISGQKGVNQNYDKSTFRVPRQYLPFDDGTVCYDAFG